MSRMEVSTAQEDVLKKGGNAAMPRRSLIHKDEEGKGRAHHQRMLRMKRLLSLALLASVRSRHVEWKKKKKKKNVKYGR